VHNNTFIFPYLDR